MQTFSLRLDRAHDFEVEVMEGSDLRGLVFFRLEDCMQEWSLSGAINAFFTVEPHGQLHMELAFSTAGLQRREVVAGTGSEIDVRRVRTQWA